jgi:superfamily II DNA or RNA helicase
MAEALAPQGTDERGADISLALRDYQVESLEAIAASTWRRQLVALPTGMGKTVVFAHQIARVVAAGKRALVLVHRDELVSQTLDKLALVVPVLDVGVVKAERNECDAAVVVASVQTVCRPNRMQQLGRDFSLVIVDEGHHATAPSYRAVLTYLGCFSPEPCGPLTVGYTATPERADRASLLEVFEGIVFHRDILTMIKASYLCDVRGVQVRLDMDLDRVHSRGGDFIEGELACEMTRAHAPEHVVQGLSGARRGP